MNEPILMKTGTSGPLGNNMTRRTVGSRSQKSKSHEAEDRVGRLVEASFLTPLGRVAFPV